MTDVDLLLNLASASRLFHTSDGAAFADLMIDGHRETWPLRSIRFRAWLRQQYYEHTWGAPSPSALSAALNVLEAQAQFDGPERHALYRALLHTDPAGRNVSLCGLARQVKEVAVMHDCG